MPLVLVVHIFLRKRVFGRDKRNPSTYFVSVQVHLFPVGKGNVYEFFIIRQPVKVFTKNDTPVHFTQKTTLQCNFQCNF